MRILFLFVTVFFSVSSFSQILNGESCGTSSSSSFKLKTKPWYGNNKFLDDFLEKENYNNDEILYRIPITLRVYKTSKGKKGAGDKFIKKQIQNLNYLYKSNNIGIQFYLNTDIVYVKSTRLYFMDYVFEAPLQTIIHRRKGSINVFLPRSLSTNPPLKKRSYSGVHVAVRGGIVIEQKASDQTLSHEIGHYFGLDHPHRNWKKGKRKQESVSRTRKKKGLFRRGLNCEINGDALKDTPAEPNLNYYSDDSCRYTGTLTDNWGDKYNPNLDNIMSYTKFRNCRTKFTKSQKAIMLYTLSKKRYAEKWSTKAEGAERYDFDVFEPDNSRNTATTIYFNTPQEHTFHKIYNGKKDELEDKKDWFYFQVKSYIIENMTINFSKSKYHFPKLKIAVYDRFGKVLYSYETNNNVHDELIIPKIKKGSYWIEVKKTEETKTVSSYKIKLENKQLHEKSDSK